jgi:hypothetical protein
LAFHCRREQRDGGAELLVLSLVEQRPRHGYEIGKLIEARSGRLQFRIGSLYRFCVDSKPGACSRPRLFVAVPLALLTVTMAATYMPARPACGRTSP